MTVFVSRRMHCIRVGMGICLSEIKKSKVYYTKKGVTNRLEKWVAFGTKK